MDSLPNQLAEARHLKSQGDEGAEQARTVLLELCNKYPEDIEVLIETAFIHDRLGHEADAVFYYERAIGLGLDEVENAEDVYLGLGSTYRVLGRYNDAKSILLDAHKRFPDSRSIRTFLAMALYNLAEHGQAMQLLLTVISEIENDPSLTPYKDAIGFYSDKLDQTWL